MKKIKLRKKKSFQLEKYLIGLTILLLMAVMYLAGRLQNKSDIRVIDNPSPIPTIFLATPTVDPLYDQNENIETTPTPTKTRVKIPVLISNITYYCFEDMANTVSNKQNEVVRLKRELGVCEFNYSQAKYYCNEDCHRNIDVCESNCYTTMPSGEVSNYLSTCQSDCSTKAPTCTCPNAISCQGVSSNLSKAEIELSVLIKNNCP